MLRRFLRYSMCALTLAPALTAYAQTARFSGQVTDPQNAAIPGAEVQVVSKDSGVNFQTKTDASGNYTVPYLPAGHYRIEIWAPGFNHAVQEDVALGVGQAALLNVQLTVGSAQTTVSVNAGGSAAARVDTENSEVSGTITGKEVSGIQLNGRNYTQLIALVPGVSNQTQQDEARVGLRGSVSFSVDGGRTEYNSFQVDGSETLNVGINKDHTSLIVTPSVDAIQEIKVLTSNYGAMYPSSGNGTTLVTTKSGSDAFHGDMYEFLRNEALNAKGYFDVTNGAPLYRRNDFGGTIGGPLTIPKLYNGVGKTHFFFSEEARIEKDPYAYRQAVPSVAERGGDFTDVCPGVDCPVANNSGAQLVSPAARAILNTGIIPYPDSYAGCNQGAHPTGSCYLAEVALPTYYREELFRLDHVLNEKTQLSFRYIHDEWDTTTPVPQYGYEVNSFPTIQNRLYGPGISMVARLTNTLSATLLNEFVASYVDQRITLADVAGPAATLGRPPLLDTAPCSVSLVRTPQQNNLPGTQCGIGSIFSNGFGGKTPGIVIGGNNAAYGGTGFAVDSSYMPWEHANPVYSFSDNITKILGSHDLQFGAQWVIFQRNQLNGPIGAASGDIQGLATFSDEQSQYTSGNAFADFLSMGAIASFQQDSAQVRYHQRYQIVEPYIQDDWKVTPRLTVNAGLRLSLFGTYHEIGNQAYNWEPNSYSRAIAESVQVDQGSYGISGKLAIASTGELLDVSTGKPVPIYQPNGSVDPRVTNGIVQCGVNGVPSSCMKGHLFNPSPRVGFSWNPDGVGKTAIRAGYGVFFEHGTADEANTGSLEGSAPLVLSETQLNPYTSNCIGNVASGCPLGPGAFPLNVTEIPTKAVWPYVQQWSASVQRELSKNTLSTFTYVGSKGTHLTVEREANQLIPAPAATNPFGPHEPLDSRSCIMGNGGGNFNEPLSYDGINYYLASGQEVGPTEPGYVNLETACYGEGAGGRVDPNSFREYAPGMGQIYSLENIANSEYNAFQVLLRHTAGPLVLGAAYTYSHSLDDASDRSDTTFVNSFDIRSNRASSNFDQRHLLHVSYIYELPLLTGAKRLLSTINHSPDPDDKTAANRPPSYYLTSRMAKLLLDKWEFSGLTLFETGIPFTVVNGGSIHQFCSDPNHCEDYSVGVLDNAGVYNGVGSGSYPDKIGNASKNVPHVGNSTFSQGPLLLNPGAFAAPRGLTFGDAGRNSLNNPRRWNFDIATQKYFPLPLRHETSLLFRAEAFNVFNHTQYRIYDPTLGNQANNTTNCYADSAASSYSAAGGSGTDCLTGSAFLHPVDAHRPRTIQFGLKLEF